MSRATIDVADIDIGIALSNRNAVIPSCKAAVQDLHTSAALKVDAICVGAVLRCSSLNVVDFEVVVVQ